MSGHRYQSEKEKLFFYLDQDQGLSWAKQKISAASTTPFSNTILIL